MKRNFSLAATFLMFAYAAFAQTEQSKDVYRRSSLATMIVVNPNISGSNDKTDANTLAICEQVPALFESMETPDKYDVLTLPERSLLLNEAPKELTLTTKVLPTTIADGVDLGEAKGEGGVMALINKLGVGKELGLESVNDKEIVGRLQTYFKENHTAPWIIYDWYYNKTEKKFSSFDNCLIEERAKNSMTIDEDNALKGLSAQDRKTKESNIADDLVSKSFIVVNVCTYKSGEQVIDVLMTAAKSSVAALPAIAQGAALKGLEAAINKLNLQGYLCFYKTYLFRINYSMEDFYNQWIEKNNDPAAFLNSDFGEIKYCGRTQGMNPIILAGNKIGSDAIIKTSKKNIDESIVKLQKNYEDFKTLSTLHFDEGSKTLYANIGTKEGVTEKDTYEVLEKLEDAEGKVSYKVIGTVKPIKGQILDNVSEQTDESAPKYTAFKGNQKFTSKLIRFKK